MAGRPVARTTKAYGEGGEAEVRQSGRGMARGMLVGTMPARI
jgi:hypothetical protein